MNPELIRIIAKGIAETIVFVTLTLPIMIIVFPKIWKILIPGLFPRAVKEGYIVGEVNWKQTMVIAIIMILGSMVVR